ncbi:MAG TPA: hypothetical protein VG204_05515 [Terriglobia bacterium]|nr:hypothetical protein [Terriglobia bacterium]
MNSSRLVSRFKTALLLAIILGLAPPGSLRAQVEYTVTDLGTLGGPADISTVTAVNDFGQVVGYSTVNNDFSNVHGFLWDNGVMTDLGPLGFGRPTGINDLHQVILYKDFGVGTFAQAFVWQRGTITPLPTLGGTFSYAAGINNRGQIAGSASPAGDATSQATVWFFPLPASRFKLSVTALGPNTIGGTDSEANGISDNGHIVGSADLGAIDPVTGFSISHAVSWVNDQMMDLGTLGGPISYAFGVNNSNQITGWSETATLDPASGLPVVHSFIVQNGVMTDLGTTNPHQVLTFLANGINRQGQVVGDIALQYLNYPFTYTLSGGFLWQNGTMIDLDLHIPNPPAYLSSIQGINSRGQIVGAANITPEQIHAVLLTPLPGTAVSPATANPRPQGMHRAAAANGRQLIRSRTPEGRTVFVVK